MQCRARIWESDRDSFSDFVGCNKRSALHRMFSFGGVNFSSSQELRELPTFGAIMIAPYAGGYALLLHRTIAVGNWQGFKDNTPLLEI